VLVSADEKVPIARLLTFLEHGERLAGECAKAQAALAPESGSCRFLLSQARQEAAHAMVFQGAIAWLAPKPLGEAPFLPALEEYRRILNDALGREDLLETLLAEQVILEGLGKAILTRIEEGLAKRAALFARLRRILLQQEESHHGFGRRMIERAMADGRIDAETLCRRAQEYLSLTDRMMLPLSDLFEAMAEDPSAYANDARAVLPEWVFETGVHD